MNTDEPGSSGEIDEKRQPTRDLVSNKIILVLNNEDHEDVVLDGTSSKLWRTTLYEAVNDYDHYYELKFRFDFNPTLNVDNSERFKHIQIHIPSQAFVAEESTVALTRVCGIADIPKSLAGNKFIAQKLEQNKLQCLNLTYDKHFVLDSGTFDYETATEGADVLHFLRQLGAKIAGEMPIFMPLGKLNRIGKFKDDILNSTANDPMSPYNWQGGHPHVNWRSEKKLEDVPNFEYDPPTFFHTLDHWYITYAYGTVRDQRYIIDEIATISSQPRDIQILEIPRPDKLQVSDRIYYAFSELTEKELAMKCLDVGQKFEVWFFDPNTEDPDMEPYKQLPQWRGQVLPPIPELQSSANFIFLLTRPRSENFDDIPVNQHVSDDMKSLTVYFQPPENSEVPAKRMMNALNAVYHGTSDKHIDLRRFLLGQSPKTPHPLDFLDALSQSQKEQVETLKRKHRPDQQTAFQRVEKSKGSAFILGPPRSGKSYFISTLTQMVAGVAKKKVLITCPSNAAVDALAKTINNDAPELGAVSYHSLPFESGATENSLRAHHVQKAQSEDVEAEQEDDEDPDRLESPQQYSNLMHFAIQQSKSYNTKQTRPNFQNVSLMAGCLKSAGLPDDENTKVDSDVARGFRGVF
ncbi:MAG: hypothetical protein Q9196_003055 [Gyalolechia fulgens]